MVPTTLDGWSLEVVQRLCEAGRPESNRHDFKGGLQPTDHTTKIACAFANSEGGFLVYGIGEVNHKFRVDGMEPDAELYGKLMGRIKADPEISVPSPQIIDLPGSSKRIYVFEILKSWRRPHLPSNADKRVFWKRSHSNCEQMTLEEIRFQMLNMQERIDKMTVLLIDFGNASSIINADIQLSRNQKYNNASCFNPIIDEIFAEIYPVIKDYHDVVHDLNVIRVGLRAMSAQKSGIVQHMPFIRNDGNTLHPIISQIETLAVQTQSTLTPRIEAVSKAFKRLFGIEYAP